MEKDMLYICIGRRIREIRERQNISQNTLGEQIPLSRSSIVNIEHGKHRVQLHVLYMIADSLNVSIYHILCAIEEHPPVSIN